MAISAVYGLPGKGKSIFAIYYGIHLANYYESNLVCNFILNPNKLAKYCQLMNYKWLLSNIHRVFYINSLDNAEDLFALPDSVIVFDEASISLPARGHASTSKKLLADLCQVRKQRQHLIYICQSDRQVEIALKLLAEDIFYAKGTTIFSKKLKNDKLMFKTVHRFLPENYEVWMGDPKIRRNPIKTKILCNKTWSGFLTAADLYLFDIYNSFQRLDVSSSSTASKVSGLHYVFKPGIDDFISDENFYPHITGHNPYKCHKLSFLSAFFLRSLKLPRLQLSLIPG